MGRISIYKCINVTIKPSVVSVIYSSKETTSLSYVTSTTPVDCMTSEVFFVSTVYITPTSTISSQACVFSQPVTVRSTSTVYTNTIITTLFTGSFCKPSTTSTSIMNTSPSLCLSKITITVEKSSSCFNMLPTTQPNQSSLSSSVVVGGVMGYVIIFILCIVGTAGGFFCGRSSSRKQRLTMTEIIPPVTGRSSSNDYEGRRNEVRASILNKNQTLPLPMLPHNNGEEIYDDTGSGIYMEMDNLQEEKKSSAIAPE